MKITLKTIAGFEILTGLLMFVNIFFLLGSPEIPEISIVKHILFLIVYLGVVFAGVLLWKKMSLGLSLSIVAQCLHLITFDIYKIAYRFAGLVDFFIYFRMGEGIGFNGYLGGRYAFTIYDEAGATMVGINIIAVILLIILLKAKGGELKDDA